jgi:hypothetical protein
VLALAVLDFAEADEGMHLVEVMPDLPGERPELRDPGIDFDVKEVFIALKFPKQAIEQVPAMRRAMMRGEERVVEKRFGNMRKLAGVGTNLRSGWVGRKESERGRRRIVCVVEVDEVGECTGEEQIAS